MLSGGIGSGKSAVRKMLDDWGVLTIDADAIGHEVLDPTGPAFSAVAERWRDVVENGRIDRTALAGIVFSDPVQLAELEAITHPHIFGRIQGLVEESPGKTVVEVPVLNHSLGPGWQRLIVDCLDPVRVDRLIERGMGRSDVVARMNTQPQRAQWLALADLVIPNHGSLDEMKAAVDEITPVL